MAVGGLGFAALALLAALFAVELCILGALGWHQVMGRSEPGPARFHALVSVLMFGSAGALVSWDLSELLAFWGLAAVATYLLLAHRGGQEEAAIRARVALALPFATDLSLLCGVAWLYSRYGVQNLNTLLPILHTNPGWTVRSLVVASILLFVGVAGRLALWPLQSWLTRTAVTAPPAASWRTKVTASARLSPIFSERAGSLATSPRISPSPWSPRYGPARPGRRCAIRPGTCSRSWPITGCCRCPGRRPSG